MERDKDRGFGTDCKSDESYVSAFAFLQLHHSYLHIGHLIIQVAPFTYNLTIYIYNLPIYFGTANSYNAEKEKGKEEKTFVKVKSDQNYQPADQLIEFHFIFNSRRLEAFREPTSTFAPFRHSGR